MNKSTITALTACLVLLLAAPEVAQGKPAVTKSGGAVVSGPDTLILPSSPPGPPPLPTPGGGKKKPDRVTPIKVVVKKFKDTRDTGLKGMPVLIGKPPKDPNTARSQLVALFEPMQRQLSSIALVIMKRAGKAGGGGRSAFDVQREREYLEKLYKLAAAALEHQLEMAANRRALQKAAEDAPQLVKALVTELQAVNDKVQGYLTKSTSMLDKVKQVFDSKQAQIFKIQAQIIVARAARGVKRKEMQKRVVSAQQAKKQIVKEFAKANKRFEYERTRLEAEVERLTRERDDFLVEKRKRELAALQERWKYTEAEYGKRAEYTVDMALKINQELLSMARTQTTETAAANKRIEELTAELNRLKEEAAKDAERERAQKFVETIGANVQHVWLRILDAGKDLLGKKENNPEAFKKRMLKIVTLPVAELLGIDLVPGPYKQAATAIKKAMKKGHEAYKESYARAVAARMPLVTGSAVHGVAGFKGAKPHQIVVRSKGFIPPVGLVPDGPKGWKLPDVTPVPIPPLLPNR